MTDPIELLDKEFSLIGLIREIWGYNNVLKTELDIEETFMDKETHFVNLFDPEVVETLKLDGIEIMDPIEHNGNPVLGAIGSVKADNFSLGYKDGVYSRSIYIASSGKWYEIN